MFETIVNKYDFIPERGKEKSAVYLFIGTFSLFFGLLMDGYIFNSQTTTIVYVPFVIMVGVIFQSMITHFILSGAVTTLLLVNSSAYDWSIELFILRLFGYFFLSLVIYTLIRSIQKEREHIINLTSTLAEAVDARDKYTSFHSKNVAIYSKQIAKAMGLPKYQCQHIYIGGLLHDIGKIGIPEAILNKPARLTEEEYEIIKKHPEIGYKMLKYIPFLREVKILDMVLYHHERYDGKGYPRGLVGDEIPLEARIMSVADTFDAMTSRRIYRATIDIEQILSEIKNNIGKQFDKEVVEAFLDLYEKGEIKILGQPTNHRSITDKAN
ncbi:HD-GYP domain-containing protein [Cytobacillus spongiae]|uniref:HD-GYP domain-containing protein n=1 Tax=Cytobacillus spongiae TaxID=2901381 RepID=UPI001F46F492|nr:HD-GYP domain-containing protein [Cytobacillus spongiae]UII56260.1 HD-GYP domain-containing protein [Cytobacillus spongiae]